MGSKQVEKIDVNSAAPKFFRGVRKKWVCRSCSGFLHEVIVAVVQDAPSPPLPFFLLKPAKWFMPRKESAIGSACYAVAVNRGVRWKALPSFDAPSCERQLLIRSNALLYISVCYKE